MHLATHPIRLRTPLLVGAIVLAAVGFAAAWVMLGLVSRGPTLWMMPMATLDMALVLALFAEPPGPRRAVLAATGCALAIALGLWASNAVQFGRMLGLTPLAAIDRQGTSLAFDLMWASLGLGGVALAAGSIVAAGLWGFLGRINGRRRSP